MHPGRSCLRPTVVASSAPRPASGGYTGQGKESLHLTVRGKIQPGTGGESATEQFSISDDRDARTVEGVLQKLGLDPVWKDWDAEILSASR